jgi:hypothetical protein
MSIPKLAFKIAAEMIEQRLLQQQMEPADQPQAAMAGQPAGQVTQGQSALRHIRGQGPDVATEPAPKIVSTTGGRNL